MGILKQAVGVQTLQNEARVVLGPTLATTAKMLGIGAAFSLGAALINSGYKRIADAITSPSEFRAVLKENPDLRAKYSEQELRKMFNTVKTFSPEITKSPIVAGAVIRNAMEYKDVGLSPATIKDLLAVSQMSKDVEPDIFGKGLPFLFSVTAR